ncbi:MAG: family peptidase, partial [Pseudomonadota bacterium]
MFVVHFLLLLVPLVLFHELGHFLVARWMGVRVLSFSIGFGPVVAAWTRDGTEYAIRALPLGGFVRMLGDDPAGGDDEGPPPPDSFAAKPVWRRSLIVAAGPIANLLLPIAILFGGSMLVDGEVVSSRIGTVLPGGPADTAGMRSGDRVLRIDGEAIGDFMDLKRVVSARPGKRVPVELERDGEAKTLWLTPEVRRDMRLPEIGVIDTVGRIQVLPDAQAAIVQVRPDGPAFAAGLRSGDRVLSVDGKPTRRLWEVTAALKQAEGREVRLQVAPPRHSEPLDE